MSLTSNIYLNDVNEFVDTGDHDAQDQHEHQYVDQMTLELDEEGILRMKMMMNDDEDEEQQDDEEEDNF